MPLQFHRPVENMEIWSAGGDGFSFVISLEPYRSGLSPTLRVPGELATTLREQWRDQDQRVALPNIG